jgi:hypothetical protein
VISVALLAVGVAALAGTLILLRSLGPRYRVGRLLSAAPAVEITEARALAAGKSVYVRVNGRISSDEEFPDENDRPLVYRRKRIEVGGPGRWSIVADEREAVPFGVETRSDFIALDEAALGVGLVAIPRVAEGTLADLPADIRSDVADTPPNAPARLVIEQLSAVEHATVCGMPVLRDGQPTLTAGLGRPLIVTTLEIPAAMRLLAAGHRRRVIAAAALLATGLGLLFAAAVTVLAGL